MKRCLQVARVEGGSGGTAAALSARGVAKPQEVLRQWKGWPRGQPFLVGAGFKAELGAVAVDRYPLSEGAEEEIEKPM